ncbi:hypothetical protein SAMN05443252_104308 [Bacillus sp. OV322]|uniref:hypothetical protein n=1 Tax=Bacillus sp. OV322 TaxID=1882764 RepID=UPI0008EBC3BE|nr:hypothetical protein [Bacillus sp. OV322]SFC55991.1 hypothetical protein SAMN05443252_104308 [Bacillus sp. OV322]
MGLEHEFYLIPKTVDVKDFWVHRGNSNDVIDRVVIQDDLIHYFSDSLQWIPSKNPSKPGNPKGHGINYYGITLFDIEASMLIKGIFTSWRHLFTNAPDTFEITSDYVHGDKAQDRDYEKIFIKRNEVIKLLEKMISIADRLSEGNSYLFHCGV